jgi:hypothetical protein
MASCRSCFSRCCIVRSRRCISDRPIGSSGTVQGQDRDLQFARHRDSDGIGYCDALASKGSPAPLGQCARPQGATHGVCAMHGFPNVLFWSDGRIWMVSTNVSAMTASGPELPLRSIGTCNERLFVAHAGLVKSVDQAPSTVCKNTTVRNHARFRWISSCTCHPVWNQCSRITRSSHRTCCDSTKMGSGFQVCCLLAHHRRRWIRAVLPPARGSSLPLAALHTGIRCIHCALPLFGKRRPEEAEHLN